MIKAVILDDEIKGSNLMQHKLKAFSEQVEVLQVFNDPQEALGKVKAFGGCAFSRCGNAGAERFSILGEIGAVRL